MKTITLTRLVWSRVEGWKKAPMDIKMSSVLFAHTHVPNSAEDTTPLDATRLHLSSGKEILVEEGQEDVQIYMENH